MSAIFRGTYHRLGSFDADGALAPAAGTVAITPAGGSTVTDTLDADGAYEITLTTVAGPTRVAIVETLTDAPAVRTTSHVVTTGEVVDTSWEFHPSSSLDSFDEIAAALATKATTTQVDTAIDTAIAALSGTYAPNTAGNRVIALGDSITLGDKPNTGVAVAVATTPGPEAQYVTKDPLWWAQLLSDQRIVYMRNAGKLTDTSAGMLARVASDVVAHAPDWCFFLAGTNDINTSVPLATYIANVTAIHAACKAANIAFAIGTIPPRVTDALNKTTETFNAWIRQWAALNSIPLADFHAAMLNPTTGGMTTAYTHDGVHPSSAGAWLMGQVWADTMAPFLRTPGETLVQSNASAATNNLLTNGLFIGDANSDGLADGWTSGLNGATASLVSDPAILGNWQRITPAVISVASQFYQSLTVDTTNIAVGDVLRVSGLLQTYNPIGTFSSLGAGAVRIYDVAHAISTYLTPEVNDFAYLSGGAPTFPLSTPPRRFQGEYTVPAGATTLNVIPLLRTSGTTLGGCGQVAQLSVVNLTKLGIPSRLAA